ncbi:MAG: CHASE4 domain-containing protein [Phycisphaerales bacterium]
MSLRTKVIALVLCVYALATVIALVVQKRIILPQFQQLERTEARTSMDRCIKAIHSEQEHLSVTARDWGGWDDTYRYVQGQNPAFAESNFSENFPESIRLNLALFYDEQGRLVWGRALAPGFKDEVPLSEYSLSHLPAGSPLLHFRDNASQQSGIVQTEHGLMLLAARPITPTEVQSGPSKGTIIYGRLMDESFMGVLRSTVELNARVWAPRASDVPREAAEAALASFGSADRRIVERSDDELGVYGVMAMLGSPDRVLVGVDVPRSIMARGRSSVNAALYLLMMVGACTGVIVMVAMRAMVLRPVAALAGHATAIANDSDLTRRVEAPTNDEIGELGRDFNQMMERLSATQAALVEASRRAGQADVAANVLHNIGNVLNAVLVSRKTLSDIVTHSRMSDIARLSDLLTQNGPDLARFVGEDPRGKLIPGFVSQLAEQWTRESGQIATELARIDESLSHIRDVMEAQRATARPWSVLEPVRAGDIAKSAMGVMTSSLTRHGIAHALDVRTDATLKTDRVTIMQVLVNLLTNAKESVLARGAPDRSIRFVVDTDEQGRITYSVVDNGGGISAETLRSLFRQGFTTKAKGQGLGLHYSMLSVQRLGGDIRAASEGEGRGATFTVTLPVSQASEQTRKAAAA